MAFSVSRSRPFRSLGLYKSSGKHAAPKGRVPAPEPSHSHRPAHAATMPRLTGAHTDASPTTYTAEDTSPADSRQQAA
jgi:hypothetical protein